MVFSGFTGIGGCVFSVQFQGVIVEKCLKTHCCARIQSVEGLIQGGPHLGTASGFVLLTLTENEHDVGHIMK